MHTESLCPSAMITEAYLRTDSKNIYDIFSSADFAQEGAATTTQWRPHNNNVSDAILLFTIFFSFLI